MCARKPGDSESMRVVRVNNFKVLLIQDFAQAKRPADPQQERGNEMHWNSLCSRSFCKQGILQCHQLHILSSRMLATHREEDKKLPAAPVRASVNVQNLHFDLAYTIADVRARNDQ